MTVIGCQKRASVPAMFDPEIDAELTLFSAPRGGRKTPIRGEYRGVFSIAKDLAFSKRLQLSDEASLLAEQPTIVGVQFLCPNDALLHFKVGTVFSVWEGRTIGQGRVVKVR